MNLETVDAEIDKILKVVPPYMEDERALLELVKNSIVNHLIWAYANKPYDKHDHATWEKVCKARK